MSHAVIVSRELDIPLCDLGRGRDEKVADGMLVEVEGTVFPD